MGRRKELKNIAYGLINSFISRNNDVFGYWGIGKLYSHMLYSHRMEIKIDLIHTTIIPQSKEFRFLISEYLQRLFLQVKKRKIDSNCIVEANILLTGFPNEQKTELGKIAPNRMNCKLIIKDDLGRTHIAERNVWCRKHNPKSEMKSTREYKWFN